MNNCADCGCAMYGGSCTNCNEEVFIGMQYHELGECIPQTLREKINQSKKPLSQKEYKNLQL